MILIYQKVLPPPWSLINVYDTGSYLDPQSTKFSSLLIYYTRLSGCFHVHLLFLFLIVNGSIFQHYLSYEVPHKIWARSVQPVWTLSTKRYLRQVYCKLLQKAPKSSLRVWSLLLDMNKQTPRQAKYKSKKTISKNFLEIFKFRLETHFRNTKNWIMVFSK